MLLIIKAIIIAIVEGITEFLPISSTGHMIIVGDFINFKGPFADLFMIVIQLGAILAIVVLYWDKIINTLKPSNLMPGGKGFKFWLNILIAFIPAAVVGVLFDDKIEAVLFNPVTVAAALLVGGILLIIVENRFRRTYKTKTVDDITITQALKIGLFQCLALWPGMSRSSSTIMGAWISGCSTVAAAEFSFFLAIPTMVAASGFKLIKSHIILTNIEIITLGIGFIVAFLVALLVVEKFINFLQKKPMRVFAAYRIFVGALLLLLALFGIVHV